MSRPRRRGSSIMGAGVLAVLAALAAPARGETPGSAAAARLGSAPVDLAHPPAYDERMRALDALGAPAAGDFDEALAPLEPVGVGAGALPVRDGRLELSLEEAVFTGLRNNSGLRIEQLNPVIAGSFEAIERAVYDPTLFVDAEFGEEELQQTDRATQRQFTVKGVGSTVRAGVLKRLPTGTEIDIALSQNRTDSDRTPSQYESRLGLTLTQALLRGRSVEANLALIRQAEVDTLLSVYELRGFTETLIAEIERTYWDYVLAGRRIEIVRAALDVARQQLDETAKRIAVGQLPETEIAAARAEEALRKQDLIDARSDLEKSRLRLLQLLSPDAREGWALAVEATSDPASAFIELEGMEDRLALALRLRPEMNQARLALERGELEVVRTRNGLLPVLDLFITLGKSSFAGSFDRSFADFDGPSYDVAAGLRFEFPVGNRAARAADYGARANREQAEASLRNLAQLVSLDVRTAYVETARSRDQIGASGATRALQAQVLETEQARFRVGNSTAFDVALAQRDYLESRIGEVEAVIAYRQALIDLYRLEGTLLMRRGIDIPGGAEVGLSAR